MTDETPPPAEHKTSRWPGWIWAVPVAAALIVGWLGFKQLAEGGPSVTVIFPTGGGIKPDDTKVQLEGIEVGQVDSVRFEKDMHHVRVKLRLNADMEGHLGKGTRFWIAGGKPSLTNLAALKTAITGPYIGVQPKPGSKQDHYDGLAEKPPDAGDARVAHFVLRTDRLGTVSRGSPIYYRDLQVGAVADAQLESDNRHFRIDVFVNAPFDRLVHSGTRFWDASAVQVAMAGNGPRLQMQSVGALFEGAVDFETPADAAAGPVAAPDTVFTLYDSRDKAEHAPGPGAVSYRAVFHAAEAGALDAGAPVKLDQKRIGTVTQSTLQYDPASGSLDDVVTLALDPHDIALAGGSWAPDARPQMDAMLRRLVGQGLRARLGSTIPVVGGKAVELAFVPKAAPATLGGGDVPTIPTGPASSVAGIMAAVNSVAAKIDAMPLDQIADNIHQATQHIAAIAASPQITDSLNHLDESMANVTAVTRDAKAQAGPILAQLRRVAAEAQSTIASVRGLVSSNPLTQSSQTGTAGLGNTLYELSRAARSLRELADYLDRHPEALLHGKGDAG